MQKDDVEHRLQTVIDHAASLQAIAWPRALLPVTSPIDDAQHHNLLLVVGEGIDHDVVAPCDNELAGPGDDAYATECRVDLKMLGDGEEPCSHALGLLEGLKRSAQRDDILE